MSGFLLHLKGPMQSYGDTGFGPLREAGAFPSRSAVLGIVAAAQGLRRNDEKLLRLHRALRVHVLTLKHGQVHVDYHTVEPNGPGQGTVQTYRGYHHDAHFIACVEGDPNVVEQAQAALQQPTFTLYLGRRSCPPSRPLLPLSMSHEQPVHALLAEAEASRDVGRRRTPFDLYLEGQHEPDGLHVIAHGYRRDLLQALPRHYVNRPYTHARIATPEPPTPLTNEDFFNALP